MCKNWIDILKTESSVKSIVNIKKDYFIWNNQFIKLSTLSNKLLYNKLVNVKFSNPIGTHYWINYQKLHKLFPTIFHLESKTLFGIIKWKSFHLNILSLFSSRNLKMKKYRLLVSGTISLLNYLHCLISYYIINWWMLNLQILLVHIIGLII
jgi:hypothetical protein